MTSNNEQIPLTDIEMEAVKRYAEQEGIDVEAAASRLFSKGLAQRMRKSSGKTPASNVMKFHKGRKL